MATPLHKNPCPGDHEIYNFGRPFLGHNYSTTCLGLSDLCLGVEKTFLKKIMHFHNMSYMTTPLHKNRCPRGHEIYNFGKPFLAYHYYILGLSDLCLVVEKKIFLKKYSNFTLFTPQLPPLWVGGHEIYNFLSPYPTDAKCQIWLRLAE